MKTIPLKKWKKYLKYLGLIYLGTEGSHEKWDYPPPNSLNRPIVVKTNLKDVPILHIHTCLKTLGISKSEFSEEIKKI